ncbi:hypothetical protein BRAS3809_1240001 [Bradyrhizobium sp. STM 3809]|nr:hypothetical protein BRAS3809_1240001 [Bradyrhizobium sp. STM 3809]
MMVSWVLVSRVMVSRFLDGIEPMPAKTDAQFRRLKSAEKDYERSDEGGLFMTVTKTGSKLWRFAYSYDASKSRSPFFTESRTKRRTEAPGR